jgi:hypothetical protein
MIMVPCKMLFTSTNNVFRKNNSRFTRFFNNYVTNRAIRDILIKSSNVKFNINDVCNLISVLSEHFN